MSLKEDIEELARLKGVPVYKLSKELGMSSSTLSSHVKNESKKMHHYTLSIIKHELQEARLKEYNRLKTILETPSIEDQLKRVQVMNEPD